jgi:hypothetical protein
MGRRGRTMGKAKAEGRRGEEEYLIFWAISQKNQRRLGLKTVTGMLKLKFYCIIFQKLH